MNRMRLLRRIVVVVGLCAAAAAFAAGRKEPQGAMMAAGKATGADAMMSGWKVMFTSIEDAKALAAKGPTVLFFAADWCPTCQAAFKDLDANGSRLGDIKIVVVDYDTSAQLKKTYGVSYQHTWVEIDAKGAALTTWNGGGVDEILKRVERM